MTAAPPTTPIGVAELPEPDPEIVGNIEGSRWAIRSARRFVRNAGRHAAPSPEQPAGDTAVPAA